MRSLRKTVRGKTVHVLIATSADLHALLEAVDTWLSRNHRGNVKGIHPVYGPLRAALVEARYGEMPS